MSKGKKRRSRFQVLRNRCKVLQCARLATSPEFWNYFTGDRSRAVEFSTAIYVVTTIGREVLGPHRVGQISFEADEVTVGDVLDKLEKLAPGSACCWQRLLARAGVQRGPGT